MVAVSHEGDPASLTEPELGSKTSITDSCSTTNSVALTASTMGGCPYVHDGAGPAFEPLIFELDRDLAPQPPHRRRPLNNHRRPHQPDDNDTGPAFETLISELDSPPHCDHRHRHRRRRRHHHHDRPPGGSTNTGEHLRPRPLRLRCHPPPPRLQPRGQPP